MNRCIPAAVTLLTIFIFGCAGSGTPQQGGSLWTGDGGKGISLGIIEPEGLDIAEDQAYLPAMVQGVLVANISKYSAISVLDRASLDKVIAETLDLTYEDNMDIVRLGHVAHVGYMMTGSVIRTSTGYTLQINVTGTTPEARTLAAYSGTCTAAELDDQTAVQRASLDLLTQMGVQLTDRAKEELGKAGSRQAVDAQTALAKGVMAQRSNTIVQALNYFSEAVSFDSGLAEANRQLDSLTKRIESGNLGENIRNEIQLRDAWKKLLDDAIAFYDEYPYFNLVCRFVPEQGRIDWNTGRAGIIIDYWLEPNAGTDAVVRILKALGDTKKVDEWGLRGLARLLLCTNTSTNDYLMAVQAELFNEDGILLGKAENSFWASWSSRNGFDARVGMSNVNFGDICRIGLNPYADNKDMQLRFNVSAESISDRIVLKFPVVGKRYSLNDKNPKVNAAENIRIIFTDKTFVQYFSHRPQYSSVTETQAYYYCN